jgi:hypothetical protein
MPFFSRRTEAEDETIPVEPPVQEKKHGLFGHNRSPSPVRQPAPVVEEKRHGLFSRNRSPSPARSAVTTSTRRSHEGGVAPSATGSVSGRRSLLSKFGGNDRNVEMDPSIVAARERVMAAEGAERDADRALEAARVRVREAREQVKRLEREAAEEARRAQIKQFHAKEVSKRGSALGRKYSSGSPLPSISDNEADECVTCRSRRIGRGHPFQDRPLRLHRCSRYGMSME